MPVDVKNNHREDNQRIKAIHAPLMRLCISIPAQREVNHPVHGTDKNARRSHIRDPQDRLPVLLQLMVRAINRTVFLIDVCDAFFESGREALGGEVEADCDDAEEAEAG